MHFTQRTQRNTSFCFFKEFFLREPPCLCVFVVQGFTQRTQRSSERKEIQAFVSLKNFFFVNLPAFVSLWFKVSRNERLKVQYFSSAIN